MNGKKARLLRQQAQLTSANVAAYETKVHKHKPIYAYDMAGELTGHWGYRETKTLKHDNARAKYQDLKNLYKTVGV